jgi:uncharacterized protein DUF1566
MAGRVVATVAAVLAASAVGGAALVPPRAAPSERAAPAAASKAESAPRARSWDRILPVSRRFVPALDGGAILDRETGLVWEQAPDTATVQWVNAPFVCYAKTVGGRKGWRLPAVEELSSLVDPNAASPALPPGHPFTGVQSDFYWTTTSIAGLFGEAYGLSMADGTLLDQMKSSQLHFWCVRGGLGYDGM